MKLFIRLSIVDIRYPPHPPPFEGARMKLFKGRSAVDFGYLEPRLSLAQPLPADLKLFMHSLACSKKWESSVDYCSASAIKRNVTAI